MFAFRGTRPEFCTLARPHEMVAKPHIWFRLKIAEPLRCQCSRIERLPQAALQLHRPGCVLVCQWPGGQVFFVVKNWAA